MAAPKTTVYYFHNDAAGAPEEMTDEEGRIVWQGRCRTWGKLTLEEHPHSTFQPGNGSLSQMPQNLRFQGQYHDRETNLHYNTFRYYDPDIGRFITEDPIGLAGGINLYQYAPNPLTWIDPWGWAQIPASAPGYTVYGLYAPGVDPAKGGKPYYVGITNDPKQRTGEHRGTGRLPDGATMRPIARDVTYGEARG